MTTTDDDKGRERILKEIAQIEGKRVVVGYWNGAGDGQPAGYAAVALYNERGTFDENDEPVIPARPFMANAFDRNKTKFLGLLMNGINEIYDGQNTVDGVLFEVGIEGMNAIKIEITTGEFVPNAPSTLEKKFPSTKPLVDDGAMRDFVLFEVRGK